METPRSTSLETASALAKHPLPVRGASTPWRWAMASVGVTCFALGIVGVFLPVMPTTVFLLLGSFFLTRSCPWLEERMLRVPVLRPYAEFIRSREPMSQRMRVTAMVMMWVSIGTCAGILLFADRMTPLIGGLMGGLGAAGTIAILLFRRAGR